MILYVISITVLQYGLLRLDETDNQALFQAMAGGSATMGVASLAVLFELLVGIAISIFAFLLVEGFEKTSDYRAYLIRIIICAILSELPYDYAKTHSYINMDSQNHMFALAIGLILLYGIRLVTADHNKHVLVCTVMFIAALAWCYLLHVEFGVFTVALILVYYIFRENRGLKIFLGVIVGLPMVTGIFATYPLYIYSGKRGVNYNKYIFYAVYPLSLVICNLICTNLR